MDDGTEREFGPGDAFHMPSGHDARIVGDEQCVLLDFGGHGAAVIDPIEGLGRIHAHDGKFDRRG